jgi:hypothetical protein
MGTVDESDLYRSGLIIHCLCVTNSRRSRERLCDFHRIRRALGHDVDVRDQLVVSSDRSGYFGVRYVGMSIDIRRQHVRLDDCGREALEMGVATHDLDPAQNFLRSFFTELW